MILVLFVYLSDLNLVEAAGVAPATRCLQGSVATPAHAPPFQMSEARGQISGTSGRDCPLFSVF